MSFYGIYPFQRPLPEKGVTEACLGSDQQQLFLSPLLPLGKHDPIPDSMRQRAQLRFFVLFLEPSRFWTLGSHHVFPRAHQLHVFSPAFYFVFLCHCWPTDLCVLFSKLRLCLLVLCFYIFYLYHWSVFKSFFYTLKQFSPDIKWYLLTVEKFKNWEIITINIFLAFSSIVL